MVLQVLFCLFALYMLTKYLPQARRALRRDPERREGGVMIPMINVVLALGILVMVLLSVVMKALGGGLIWR
jgi:predicted transcriptional regulator with HTH domain